MSKVRTEPLYKAGDKVRWIGGMGSVVYTVDDVPTWKKGGWWYPLMGFPGRSFSEASLYPNHARIPEAKFQTGDKVKVGGGDDIRFIEEAYYSSSAGWLYTLTDVGMHIFMEEELQRAVLTPAERIQEEFEVVFVFRRDMIGNHKESTLTEAEVVELVKKVRNKALDEALEVVRGSYQYGSYYAEPIPAIEALKEQP